MYEPRYSYVFAHLDPQLFLNCSSLFVSITSIIAANMLILFLNPNRVIHLFTYSFIHLTEERVVHMHSEQLAVRITQIDNS